MSVADLSLVAAQVRHWLAQHMPAFDAGAVLSTLGLLILGLLGAYYGARLALGFLRWIAGLTPEGFAKLLLVLGIFLVVAGAIVP